MTVEEIAVTVGYSVKSEIAGAKNTAMGAQDGGARRYLTLP
jgi:hypothetical protein